MLYLSFCWCCNITIRNGTFTVIDAFQPDGISSLDMTLFEDKKNGEVHGVYLVRSCGNSYVGIWMKII